MLKNEFFKTFKQNIKKNNKSNKSYWAISVFYYILDKQDS